MNSLNDQHAINAMRKYQEQQSKVNGVLSAVAGVIMKSLPGASSFPKKLLKGLAR